MVSCHATNPRSITADGDKAYPVAIRELKEEKCILHGIPLREKYLNNIIEPIIDLSKTDSEYAWIEILANDYKMIAGIEAMHMIKRTNSPRGEVCPKANVSYR